jgi:hypothetical protein
MDCFIAEMSAPRVTVSALMRRGWRQLEMQNVKRVHHYQRERASITGLRLELQKSM